MVLLVNPSVEVRCKNEKLGCEQALIIVIKSNKKIAINFFKQPSDTKIFITLNYTKIYFAGNHRYNFNLKNMLYHPKKKNIRLSCTFSIPRFFLYLFLLIVIFKRNHFKT
jgi:hypothetical protein